MKDDVVRQAERVSEQAQLDHESRSAQQLQLADAWSRFRAANARDAETPQELVDWIARNGGWLAVPRLDDDDDDEKSDGGRTAVDADHLEQLIARAEDDPEAEYMQPQAAYVMQATDEFEAAGFDKDEVPWGAIAMRAHELQDERKRPRKRTNKRHGRDSG